MWNNYHATEIEMLEDLAYWVKGFINLERLDVEIKWVTTFTSKQMRKSVMINLSAWDWKILQVQQGMQ